MWKSLRLFSFIFGSAIAVSPAQANNIWSWVSAANGSDANDCTAAHPCATMSYAVSKTIPTGTVFCVDAGAFASVSITKSITIDCTGGLWSATTPDGSGGPSAVTVATSDRVILRGLKFTYPGTVLQMNGAGSLVLEDSVFTGSNNTNSATSAVVLSPTGQAKITITNCLFSGAGNGTAGAGLRIYPSSGGTAQVTIKNSRMSGNTFGIAVDGTNSAGGINTTVIDTVMSENVNDGLVVVSSASGAPIAVTLVNSQSTNNGFGIRSIGSNVTVRVEGSKIIGNGTGLSGGGALLSGGGNTVQANGSNGGFTGSYAQQ